MLTSCAILRLFLSDSHTATRMQSSFLHVSVTVLVTVSAAIMAVGYDRTCESNKCMSPEAVGLKHFPQRDQILAAVIFCWFAILPWVRAQAAQPRSQLPCSRTVPPQATDTGFIIKRYINVAFPKKVGA